MKFSILLFLSILSFAAARAQNTAAEIMARMTVEEKIGQLFMPAAYSGKDEKHHEAIVQLIQKYHLGGLIMMQGSPLKHIQALNKFQKASKTPLLTAIDGEWGIAMRLDSVSKFPYQMAMGALKNNELLEKAGEMIAKECLAAGIHVNFAPVCDVNNNQNNPVINFRSFGENKFRVAQKSLALMRGMQRANVLACAKHFPGHGDTDADSHFTLPLITHDAKRLEDIELYPFRQLFSEKIASVMAAHLYIPKLDTAHHRPSTLSPLIINDLLIEKMKFNGLIFTDALSMKGISHYAKPGEIEIMAIEAGNDVLLFTEEMPVAFEAVLSAVKSGRISEKRIEHSCLKILKAKEKIGLLQNKTTQIPLSEAKKFESSEKKWLIRQIFEESQTVLVNKKNAVPFIRDKKTHFISLAVGAEKNNIFQNRLSDYDNIEHFNLPPNFTKKALDSIKSIILPKINAKTRLILSVHIPSVKPAKNYGITEEMQNIVNFFTKKSYTVFLGNPYAMRFFDLKKVKFLSVHYQDNADTQDLAAQLLFGGCTASGILPVTVGKFKEGSGIKTDKKIRFSYIMPEKWGLSSDTLAKKIDKIVSEAIINQAFPGCEIIAAKDGFIFFKKSYGFTTYDSAQKNEENMLYDIASLTKITAALPALMRLTEQKKIRLNKDLGTYLPEYKNSNKKGIPLRELLAHQGGLKAWIPFWKTCKEANGAWKPLTFASDSSANYPFNVVENLYLHKNFRDSIFKQILESPVAEKKYVYSDLGFYLYPKIVEKKTNKFFEQYIAENFFRPLGANSFTYNPLKKFPKHKIVPTEFDSAFRKTLLHGTVNDEGAAMTGGVSGHAGLFGTANDAAKMMQMYLDKGMYGGIRFFKEKTIAEFLRCQFCEAGNRRALGFDRVLINYNEKDSYTAKSASQSSFGHTGFTGTFMWADPKNGLLVVVMSNRVNPSRNNRKLMELNIRPRLHQVFYDFFSK